MVKKIIMDWKFRNLLFLLLSTIPVLPFIMYGRFQLQLDGWFHFSRIYEIVQNVSNGKLFLDVSYFTFNNHGYGVHFFYPYFINYPIALLWLFTNSPVLSTLIFNILIHVIGLNISFHSYVKWRNNQIFALLFSILYVFGYNFINEFFLEIGLYNQQIAYYFLPFAILGIQQVILGDAQKWYKVTLFSIVVIALSHLLTTFLLVGYSGLLFFYALLNFKKYLTKTRIITWLKILVSTFLSTALFLLPMIEQKLSNNWLSVPASNLYYKNGMLGASVEGASLWNRLKDGLTFKEPLLFLFALTILYLIYYRKFNRTTCRILIAIASVAMIQSNLVPWYILQRLSLIDMIQWVSRFDFFLYFGISLFIAYGCQKMVKDVKCSTRTLVYCIASLYCIFISFNFSWQKDGILISNLSEFKRISYLATDSNVYKGLKNPNFQYFSQWSQKGVFRTNGFMDYRTKDQLAISVGKDGKVSINEGRFSIVNGQSHRSLYNISSKEKIETNDFIENTVYFDRVPYFKKFSQNRFTFHIEDIPQGAQKIQTPITYLKGFVVMDDQGKVLKSYKNSQGWLEFEGNGRESARITYRKTVLHKISIFLSLVTWFILLLYILYDVFKIKWKSASLNKFQA